MIEPIALNHFTGAPRARHSMAGLRRRLRLLLPCVVACVGLVLAVASAAAVLPALATDVDGSAAPQGAPLVRRFTPREYGGQTQTFAVAQAANGLIYVANIEGVLEYDGVRWRTLPVGAPRVARSLAWDARTGRMYVGGIGEFGYLAPDALGRMRYHSLLPSVPAALRGFADVWRTFATEHGMLFVTTQGLYRYDGRKVSRLAAEEAPFPVFQVGSRILAMVRGRGLMELTGERLHAVAGGEAFSEGGVYTVLADPKSPSALLVGTRSRGFFRLESGVAKPWSTGIDDEVVGHTMGHGLRLPDGRLAVTSREAGLYLLDAEGRWLGRIDRRNGLPDSLIHGLFADREGGLWLALERGLARVEVSSPLRSFGEDTGLVGTVRAVARFAGAQQVGTSQGVFTLQPGPLPRFRQVAGINGQVWALQVQGDCLLVGAYAGVYEWCGAQARQIYAADTAIRLQVRSPTQVWVGARSGLSLLHRDGRNWREAARLPDVGPVLAMKPVSNNELWVQSYTAGLLRLTLPAGWPERGEPTVTVVEPPNTADYTAGMIELDTLDGELRVFNRRGVFIPDAVNRRLLPDPRFVEMFKGDAQPLRAVAQVPGLGWVMGRINGSPLDVTLGRATALPTGEWRWQPLPLPLPPDFELQALQADADGGLWLAGSEGLLHLRGLDAWVQAPLQVQLWEVRTGGGRILYGGEGPKPTHTLAYAQNRLRFMFAAPHFGQARSVRYQTRLVGESPTWSAWSTEPSLEVSNLWEGHYRFEVRARGGDGAIGPITAYAVEVLPPWYRNVWAYVSYGLAIAGLLWAVLAWRVRRAQLRQRILQMRLGLLQAQLEPHFMFNALNAVAALIRRSQEGAALGAVSALSELLRYSLIASRQRWVRLEDELEFVNGYLALQQLRFGERLRFEIDVPDDLLDTPCPALLLQPLVENAVHHGIEPSHVAGVIRIVARAEPQGVRVCITNPVMGDASTPGHGIGLASVSDRVRLIYRGSGDVVVAQDDGLFVVSVLLREAPLRRKLKGLLQAPVVQKHVAMTLE